MSFYVKNFFNDYLKSFEKQLTKTKFIFTFIQGYQTNNSKKDEKVKSFLVEMNKKTQKILFRSIKRIIMDIFNGEIDSFDSYIDDQAHQ